MIANPLPGAPVARAAPVWLDADLRPLDWKGPRQRAFTPFGTADLERPIVESVERAARRHRERPAVTDGETSLTYGDLWNGVSGLAEILAARTGPGELIALILPACPQFPLAMLACLAAGRSR